MSLILTTSKSILVTGAAGFIGSNVCRALLSQNMTVVGIDSLNDYYDVDLKRSRLTTLNMHSAFTFHSMDLADRGALDAVFELYDFDIIVHLAAQAGVRYSLINPDSYFQSNLVGFQNMIENCRRICPAHFVFASSSSVYGDSNKPRFSEDDATDTPVSLYAATKKANEILGYSYSKLYGIPMTGLRFFTVYGPAGRPDMAYFGFTKAIISGECINIFNHGKLERDFTYIDDIVDGILSVCVRPPMELEVPYRILNLGNNHPVKLGDFVLMLERLLGREANKKYVEMQPGDVLRTCANIDKAKAIAGYSPKTTIDVGLKRFVDWYVDYYSIKIS